MMGNTPVAAVFAREITPGLTGLVKKLEQATADHSDCQMGAWVVVLTDDGTQGPPSFKIAKDADVTVLLYEKKNVKKNFAFEKGKLTDKDVDAVVAAVQEIVPKK